MQIKDNSFLVTGASSGLSAACVRRLVAAGARVTMVDVNEEDGRALAAELGDAAHFVRADVTDEEDVQAAVGHAADAASLRGVINCAGIIIPARVVGRDGPHALDSFRKVVDVNLVGTFNVIRLAAAAMSESEPDDDGQRGVIINTASVAAFEGQIGQAAYSASKGGIASMTLPIARELARFGVRVVAIAPGIFETPMMAGLPEEVRQSLADQVPFPSRLGHPHEYAALAQHIIENPMLNGDVIRLDGAIRMAAR
jgi:NAD(P)-dependent dehydrogenase (short-subunit alcohol dehydrogenase family)